MFKYRIKNTKGFTLIEVLIVVAIIGILTAILVANYNEARKNSRDKIRKSDLKSIQLSLELYKAQTGSYPVSMSSLTPTYLPQVPTDPNGTSQYTYISSGTTYKVLTTDVESILVSSIEDEFSRYAPSCGQTVQPNTYAVYSAGAECD